MSGSTVLLGTPWEEVNREGPGIVIADIGKARKALPRMTRAGAPEAAPHEHARGWVGGTW